MTETLGTINQRLKERYGDDLTGRANFRLVWADDQLEKRFSTYRDFYDTIKVVREVKEVRQVKKYPGFQGRYILETLCPSVDKDVKDHNGYEPLWVFQRNDEKPVDPEWFAIEYLIRRWKTPLVPITDEEIMRLEAEADEADYKKFMSILESRD